MRNKASLNPRGLLRQSGGWLSIPERTISAVVREKLDFNRSSEHLVRGE